MRRTPYLEYIKKLRIVKKIMKSTLYSRAIQYLPMAEYRYYDDRACIEEAEAVTIDWPFQVAKPRIGVVKDYDEYPRWTKYCRFLDNNSFSYEIYNIKSSDWIEKAAKYDVIIGISSSNFYDLEEMRKKYQFLEHHLGKKCYPSANHLILYEDKSIEFYLSKIHGFPFINSYVSHDKCDAMHLVKTLTYPVVSKIVPSSGSVGVELVPDAIRARRIVEKAFSHTGRKSHVVYLRQKNYVYFQDYIPNDGYDIRAIVAGNMVCGYYRKVLKGDFRASGMLQIEERELPEQAMKIARNVNKVVKSPMLVVDMLHGLDGKYHIIEFSPICQVVSPAELKINGVPGVYVFGNDDSFHFMKVKYWVLELALKGFFLNDYLPYVAGERAQQGLRGIEPQRDTDYYI